MKKLKLQVARLGHPNMTLNGISENDKLISICFRLPSGKFLIYNIGDGKLKPFVIENIEEIINYYKDKGNFVSFL